MKLTRLSTTSKLYLLTLLLIFGILFLNQSVFAQDSKATTSEKRLKIMERYLSWTESNEYGQFKGDEGNKQSFSANKILQDFKSFLSKAVTADGDCLNPNSANPSFIKNIENFFSGLISRGSSPSQNQEQLSSCKAKIKADYKLAKKYNRALKFLQIEAGQPNVCVKADLGVGSALKAKGFNPAKTDTDNPKETGVSEPLQVYLCTGNDGLKKVRAVDDSGTKLRLAPEDAAKNEFKVENLPPKGSFDILLEKIGAK